MGSGASFHEALPSAPLVDAARQRDKINRMRQRDEEFLAREQRLSGLNGFDASASHMKPLMMDKLARSLACLDDVSSSHAADQRRAFGHTQVPATALSANGPVRRLCLLGDTTTLACASEAGPLWLLNWREGRVVSTMRAQTAARGGPAHFDGPVSCLCPATKDCSLLATGDERGFLTLWDLSGPKMELVVRLHENRIAGLQSEWERHRLITTSSDSYIILYDMQWQGVTERGLPESLGDGSGVPNTMLTIGGEKQRHLLLVGGGDGKLRVWKKDQGPMRREHTLSCGGAQPMHCCIASDGWQAIVGTGPADATVAGAAEPGGLLLFDLRRLGGKPDDALVKRIESPEYDGQDHVDVRSTLPKTGVVDMALVEEGGERIAFCVMDGIVRAFDLSGSGGPLRHKFDFDVLAPYDTDNHGLNKPCALAATGRLVFTASTAPSVGVWFRQDPTENYGHSAYVPTPPPPMMLRARFMPAASSARTVTGPRVLSAVEKLEAALENDRLRLAGVPRARPPFEPFQPPEVTYPAMVDGLPGHELQYVNRGSKPLAA